MPSKLLVVGQKFSRLTVIKLAGTRIRAGNKKDVLYLCRCECGKTTKVEKYRLTSGHTKSCGCLHKEVGANSANDLLGQKFERLTVIERAGSKDRRALWLCECECGNTRITLGKTLLNGKTQSCGCLQVEARAAQADNLLNQKFGLLTVIERAGSQNGKALWLCLCECGNTTYSSTGNLNSGLSASCGCMRGRMGRGRKNSVQSRRKNMKMSFNDFRAYLNQRGFELKSEIDEETWTGPRARLEGGGRVDHQMIKIECLHVSSHSFTCSIAYFMDNIFGCPLCHIHEGSTKDRVKALMEAMFELNNLKIEI